MSKNTGGPAYPAPFGLSHVTTQGMTLRDHFAGLAMQGMLSAGLVHESDDRLAENSYKIADAMLARREK